MKILYGQQYKVGDFDQVTRVRGTQTRIVRKGTTWFVLNRALRVIAIVKSVDLAHAFIARRYQMSSNNAEFRLHNIEYHNRGRCSKAKCKEIFDSIIGTLVEKSYRVKP